MAARLDADFTHTLLLDASIIVTPSQTTGNHPRQQHTPIESIGVCDWTPVGGLQRSDVGGLQALGALLNGELHLLALVEVAEPLALDSRIVDKHIGTVVLSDEPITLRPAEPLHRTCDAFAH